MFKKGYKMLSLFMAGMLPFNMVDTPIGQERERTVYARDAVTSYPAMRMSYDKPAGSGKWESEALPLGNGYMGAMVFGDVNSDRIQVNEESIWSGGPGKNPSYKGGTNGSSTKEVHEALQTVRNDIQAMVEDFSQNSAAHIDEYGDLITEDYPDLLNRASFARALEKLKGVKDDYGSYQTLGNIVISEKSSVSGYTDYKRVLDLDHAKQEISYRYNGTTYKREYFMNNPSNVMVIRLTASEGGKISKHISVNSEQTKKTVTADEASRTITMEGQPSDQRSDGLKFAQQIKVIPSGGTVTRRDSSTLTVDGADSILILMTADTNYQADAGTTYHYFTGTNPLEPVRARINAASNKTYEELYEEHVSDYKGLFDRVKLNLGATETPAKTTDQLLSDYSKSNSEMEDIYLETLFYQYGRYLLIASSRENSKLPANLQGIWAEGLTPPWSSDFHTNINLQMNYWLAQQTNLSECHEPLIRYVNDMVEKGKETAKKYYCKQDGSDVRGWVIHHENNIWGNTNPSNWTTAFYFPAAAAWMCQDIWEMYAFNQDVEYLKENYDTLLQAALFWVDNLWVDARDGTLVANPSYSPEHGVFSLGTSSDQALIWEMFEIIKKTSKVLGTEGTAEVKEVLEAMDRLYMPRIGLGGQLGEWKDETTLEVTNYDDHRHQNHLAIVHPGTYTIAERSEKDDALVEAMKVTLNVRGDGGTGWSKAWKINMWARLRDGDRAAKLLKEQIQSSTLSNLFDTHPPFQIDGNFGATSGITEMLLQSQGDAIELLPALPSKWRNGKVEGVKARGNFTINETWADGVATEFEITSNAGNPCTVKYGKLSEATVVRVSDGETMEVGVIDNDTIRFDTEAGETYRLTDLSTEILTSNPKTFLGGTVNNLYRPSIIRMTNAKSRDGVYFERFGSCSMAERIGFQTNDVITGINDEEVYHTNQLMVLYDGIEAGTEITFRVWRYDRDVQISYTKTEDDNVKVVPGLIQAEDADEMVNCQAETCGDVDGGKNLGYIENGSYAVYKNIYFDGKPTKFTVRAAAFNQATPELTVRLDGTEGPVIAKLNLTHTGAYQTYANNQCDIQNVSSITGAHDVYLMFGANMNVNWFAFEGEGYEAPNPTPKPTATPKPTNTPRPGGMVEVEIEHVVDLVNANKTGNATVTFNGTSARLTFPFQYADKKFSLGSEMSYDMSDYTKVIINVTASQQFRVAFFNSKGNNITGTDEWEYVAYGGTSPNTDIVINLARFNLEDVSAIAIGANCDDFQPLTVHSIVFKGVKYVEAQGTPIPTTTPTPVPAFSAEPTMTPQQTGPTPTPVTNATQPPQTTPNKAPKMTPKPTVTLKKVANLKANKKKKKIWLSWKKVKNASGYQIVYATHSKFKKSKKVTTKKTKYTIKKIQSKKRYFIKVRAYRTVGSKRKYGKYSKTVKLN